MLGAPPTQVLDVLSVSNHAVAAVKATVDPHRVARAHAEVVAAETLYNGLALEAPKCMAHLHIENAADTPRWHV